MTTWYVINGQLFDKDPNSGFILIAAFLALTVIPFILIFRQTLFSIEHGGKLILCIIAGFGLLALPQYLYKETASIYVTSTEGDATIQYGDQTFTLQEHEEMFLKTSDYYSWSPLADVPFRAVSQAGHEVQAKLGPHIYVAEVSGKRPIFWCEIIRVNDTLRNRPHFEESTMGQVAMISPDMGDGLLSRDMHIHDATDSIARKLDSQRFFKLYLPGKGHGGDFQVSLTTEQDN